MKNLLKNKRIIVITLILAISLTAVSIAANPGSSDDPLISLSYFEDKIDSLKDNLSKSLSSSLNEKFDELSDEIEKNIDDIKKNGVTAPTSFELITLGENETLILEASTEIIVRSGKSIVITSENSSGGISDVTLGKDLANGETITNNHLLIVPKSDGRGIKSIITGAVLVKGNYEKQINKGWLIVIPYL